VTAFSITIYEKVNKDQEETIVTQHNQLEVSNGELEEANQKKNLLLHILCHDLANPFGALISSLSALDEDPEMLSDLLPEIKGSLNNGIGTIELVRQIRALEEGKIELALTSILLEPLIRESLTMLKSTFKKKDISFTLDVAGDITVSVEQISFNNSVLNNLLTNAVKFSERGAEVRIHATRTSEGMIQLTISDDGIGMPESILGSLFNFQKSITRAGTSGESGTGFGMPLVEQFVRVFGGRIEVESRDIEDSPDDHGTDVVITLNA
jgi:signal transduction histidine kinase